MNAISRPLGLHEGLVSMPGEWVSWRRFVPSTLAAKISVLPESERATIRIGDADAVGPDALVIKESSIERMQVIAEILAKSVVLARNERRRAQDVAAAQRGPSP